MEFRFGWQVEPLIEAMRQIDDIHARIGGAQDGSGIDAAGVVRVEMHGNADFLL